MHQQHACIDFQFNVCTHYIILIQSEASGRWIQHRHVATKTVTVCKCDSGERRVRSERTAAQSVPNRHRNVVRITCCGILDHILNVYVLSSTVVIN